MLLLRPGSDCGNRGNTYRPLLVNKTNLIEKTASFFISTSFHSPPSSSSPSSFPSLDVVGSPKCSTSTPTSPCRDDWVSPFSDPPISCHMYTQLQRLCPPQTAPASCSAGPAPPLGSITGRITGPDPSGFTPARAFCSPPPPLGLEQRIPRRRIAHPPQGVLSYSRRPNRHYQSLNTSTCLQEEFNPHHHDAKTSSSNQFSPLGTNEAYRRIIPPPNSHSARDVVRPHHKL